MATQDQVPLGSGYYADTTAEEVIQGIDLTGKVAIVTGGYSGIGVETTRALKNAGAQVIVPTRNLAKAEETLKTIDGLELHPFDLADPDSIDAFADRFLASARPLHILINSAGIMGPPLWRDARGYEMQFATNHLGHFQLVTRLWPALVQAQGARIVSVSSWGHRRSPVVFDDPNYQHREYDPFNAYGQSKTANVLMAVEADRRGKDQGIQAFAVHPGIILDTNLGVHLSKEQLSAMGVIDDQGNAIIDASRNMKTVPQGAATSIWCAVSPQLNGHGGVYCENCDISPLAPVAEPAITKATKVSNPTGVFPHAVDPDSAHRLWALSEQLLNP